MKIAYKVVMRDKNYSYNDRTSLFVRGEFVYNILKMK